jgi:hypothetical protein
MARVAWPLLVASLVANAWLLKKVLAPPPLPATSTASGPVDPSPAPRASAPTWPLLPSSPKPAAADSSTRARASDAAGAEPIARGGHVDVELEADVLCTVAEQRLFEEWRKDRDRSVANLKRSLADREEQDRNITHVADELAAAAGIDDASRATFTARYHERRTARVLEAQVALDRAPPDFTALAQVVRGLFADEDELAQRFAGPDGRERIRAAMVEGRTTILGLVTAWGNGPPASVSW